VNESVQSSRRAEIPLIQVITGLKIMARRINFRAFVIGSVMFVQLEVGGGTWQREEEITVASEKQIDLKLDDDSATKIAEIILVKVYGERVLKQRPWKVVKQGEIFKIRGTFHTKEGEIRKGGVAEMEIRARDAAVVNIMHGK
jgi:NTF2 fold immunity protein